MMRPWTGWASMVFRSSASLRRASRSPRMIRVRTAARQGSGSAARAAASSRCQDTSSRSSRPHRRCHAQLSRCAASCTAIGRRAICRPAASGSSRSTSTPKARKAAAYRASSRLRSPCSLRLVRIASSSSSSLRSRSASATCCATAACSRSRFARTAVTRARISSSGSPAASRSRARRAAARASAHFAGSPAVNWAWPRSRPASARRLVDDPRRGEEPLRPLVCQVGPAAADQTGDAEDRGGQGDGQPMSPALLRGAGLGLDPGQLRGPQPLLHAGAIGRDPAGDLGGIPRPGLGLRRQAVARQPDQLGVGAAGVEPSQRSAGLAAGGLGLDRRAGRADERRPAGEDLAEDRAQAEDVGPLVDAVQLAAGLLGRHVRRRPQHAPGLRLAAGPTAAAAGDDGGLRHGAAPRLVGDAAVGQDLRQAPVHHLDLAEGADHHVGRLEVAVDHAAGMGIRQRLADLLEDGEEPREVVVGVGALGEHGRECAALDQLHGEVGAAVGERAELVDGDDARVLELPADAGLLDEAADDVGVAAVAGLEDLHGEVAAEVGVAGLEDDAHAAAGDLAQDLVAGDRGPVREVGGGPDDRGFLARRLGQDAGRRGVVGPPRRRGGAGIGRAAEARGQVHHLQAGPQRAGEVGVVGDQEVGVGGSAGLQSRQVRLEDPPQRGVLGGLAGLSVGRAVSFDAHSGSSSRSRAPARPRSRRDSTCLIEGVAFDVTRDDDRPIAGCVPPERQDDNAA